MMHSRTLVYLPEPSLRSRPPMPPCRQTTHLRSHVSLPGNPHHLCHDAERCLVTANGLVVWNKALGRVCQGLDAVSVTPEV